MDELKLIIDEQPRSFLDFYKDEEKDLNNFSYWYPKVSGLFRTPKTLYKKLPPEIAELILDYNEPAANQPCPDYREKLRDYCTQLSQEAINTFHTSRVFLKNARFSDKFDFNNSCYCILSPENLERHLVNLNYQSMCTDALGFTEVVIRELLDFNPDRIATIYNGMPIRPEYRAFYDFDQKKLLYISNYWDYKTVSQGLHTASDRIVFKKGWKQREAAWSKSLKEITKECQKLDDVQDMHGIWSVDFLIHSRKSAGMPLDDKAGIYLIDMALAEQSAYWDPVKAGVVYPASISGKHPDDSGLGIAVV